MNTRLVSGIVGVVALAGMGGCSDEIAGPKKVLQPIKIEILKPSNVRAGLGDSVRLRARRVHPAGIPSTDDTTTFLWESTDTTVLMVDATGMVSFVGLGTASILARFEDPAAPGTPSAADTAMSTLTLTAKPMVFHAGPVIAASTASFHHCVVLPGGTAQCRGRNTVGQTGTGPILPSTDSVATWTAVVGGLSFSSISTTGTTCARATDNRAYCWGDNSLGQFGIGSTTPRSSATPIEVGGDHRWLQIETKGHSQMCGVTTANVALCAGHNDWGQLGREPMLHADTILAAWGSGHQVTMIRTGEFLTCGLRTDGSVYCSGYKGVASNSEGYGRHPTPTRIGGSTVFTSIAVGYEHGCGLDAAGAAYCWGDNQLGQLGTGDVTASGTARPVAGGLAFSKIFAWHYTTCGVTASGEAWCWGANHGRALGRTRLVASELPIRVHIGQDVKWMDRATGLRGACAINGDSQLVCWGPFTKEVPAAIP